MGKKGKEVDECVSRLDAIKDRWQRMAKLFKVYEGESFWVWGGKGRGGCVVKEGCLLGWQSKSQHSVSLTRFTREPSPWGSQTEPSAAHLTRFQDAAGKKARQESALSSSDPN